MPQRLMRVFATLLLALATGCIPDPKVDPCRDPGARPASCDATDASAVGPDAASAPDADAASTRDGGRDSGRDAAPDADVDEELDAATDGAVEPELDAGPEPPLDATVRLDGSVVDASIMRRDAARPIDAGTGVLPLEGDLGVHDPSIIEADGAFVIFATGRGLRVKRSDDLLNWTDSGGVFARNPAWIAGEVPGATDLWAPDIAYFNGKYHLYYSASTFGSRNSCIGHATATDLTAMDFVDHGPVVCTEESDDYNAIDPGFIVDQGGTPWLSFGSFWSGIKLIRLDAEGQRAGTEMYSLASRAVVEAIEAPHLLFRDGYYYLFVSFDLCCRGSASTYRIMVGRSENVTGPYVDAEGTPMLSTGGGTTVVLGNQRWRGAGHSSLLTLGEDHYLVYHAYDAVNGGAATLRIAKLAWDDDGWPLQVGP